MCSCMLPLLATAAGVRPGFVVPSADIGRLSRFDARGPGRGAVAAGEGGRGRRARKLRRKEAAVARGRDLERRRVARREGPAAPVAAALPDEASLLAAVADEALRRTDEILNALDEQEETLDQAREASEPDEVERRAAGIARRRGELTDAAAGLRGVREQLRAEAEAGAGAGGEDGAAALAGLRARLVALGFGPLLDERPEDWPARRRARAAADRGRPAGFEGLVFHTALGAPVLVGARGAHGDAALRRAAQGADLWFQVEDYHGSRVLLRSSLVRGAKGSRACAQMAADLEARYSDWYRDGPWKDGDDSDGVPIPVMYTDSRHVAKRGGRAGQMRRRKSLGTMYGRPWSVEEITRGKTP